VTPISRRLTNSSGFTLVELLVVILIIGILAAVGLGTFLHQRAKGEDAQAKVFAATAEKALVVWQSDHGTYDGAAPADLIRIEGSLELARGLAVSGDDHSFKVSVDSPAGAQGGGTYTIERADDGTMTRTCTHPGKGSCAGSPDAQGNSW